MICCRNYKGLKLLTAVSPAQTARLDGVDGADAGGGHVVEAEDVTSRALVQHGAGEHNGRVSLQTSCQISFG